VFGKQRCAGKRSVCWASGTKWLGQLVVTAGEAAAQIKLKADFVDLIREVFKNFTRGVP